MKIPMMLACGASLAAATMILARHAPAAPLVILPLGDSITYGVNVMGDDAGPNGGYRHKLLTNLRAAGINGKFVGSWNPNPSGALTAAGQTFHEGHSGYTIDEIDVALTGPGAATPLGGANTNNGGYWLTGGHGTGRDAIHPDIVLLDIGTNDAFFSDASDPDAVVATRMQARLVNLLNDLKAALPKARIIVANLYCGAWAKGKAPAARLLAPIEARFNAALPALVASAGPNVYFVDIASRFPPYTANQATNAIGVDGLHPKTMGYDLMADAWSQVIVDALAGKKTDPQAAPSRR